MKTDLKQYIGGEWVKGSGPSFELINPANNLSLGTYHMAARADVDQAVRISRDAFHQSQWKRDKELRVKVLGSIARIIRENIPELAELEVQCNGKLIREALEDMAECAEIFEYYAGWIGKIFGDQVPVAHGHLNYVKHDPVGVCALIVPWNFPLCMACWKLAPALAAGNSILIKPSEYTPTSLVRLFELIDQQLASEIPVGIIQLLLGDGRIGQLMSEHTHIDKVSFTGSTQVGRSIVASSGNSNLKGVSLELGGKSANIFFEDTPNFDKALEQSYQAMFSHKGEKCSEPTRWFIHRSLYSHALEVLKPLAEKAVLGDPMNPSSTQGAQCNRKQYDKILKYIQYGKEDGAKLLTGGEADQSEACAKGLFIRPTIFYDVTMDMRIARDEIFGPVLALTPFETEEEVIAMANDTLYGLAGGLWTKDVSRAHRVADQIDAGMVYINHYGQYDYSSPFGGVKQSGWGKDMGYQSYLNYTKTKSIWLKM